MFACEASQYKNLAPAGYLHYEIPLWEHYKLYIYASAPGYSGAKPLMILKIFACGGLFVAFSLSFKPKLFESRLDGQSDGGGGLGGNNAVLLERAWMGIFDCGGGL